MNHPLTSRAPLPFPSREPQPADLAGPVDAGGRDESSAPPDKLPAAERDPKPSQADALHLGMEQYCLVLHNQTAYAIPADGPPIACPLRAKGGFGGTGSLRQLLNRSISPKARRSERNLWRRYRAAHGRILGGTRPGRRSVGETARCG
ncbi:hypothetical protein [Streptomyces sp. NPDC001933]|uniref:hypothetical protein n=1 Tax=Streptomyces sp. NPDC001933 TaxID=3364626 RepID=UPI0036783461